MSLAKSPPSATGSEQYLADLNPPVGDGASSLEGVMIEILRHRSRGRGHEWLRSPTTETSRDESRREQAVRFAPKGVAEPWFHKHYEFQVRGSGNKPGERRLMARGAGVALATLILLAFAAPAAAATPQQISQRIFADLADNGRLDGHYTRAQINRALHSPSLADYEGPAQRAARPQPRPAARAMPAAGNERGTLPFSGLDLALFGGVGGPLLLLGASLGRLARVKPDQELS